jgi:DNA-binding MarR family transcriptional regulator
MVQQDQLIQFQELALGSRLKRLSDHLMKETAMVYRDLQLNFDPYLMPIFKLVSEKDRLTIGELSCALRVTQPAVTQFVNALIKRKLVRIAIDKTDKRKRKVSITKTGIKMLADLAPIWKVIDNEMKILTHHRKNKTLLDHITYVENELANESFSKRILKKIKITPSEKVALETP